MVWTCLNKWGYMNTIENENYIINLLETTNPNSEHSCFGHAHIRALERRYFGQQLLENNRLYNDSLAFLYQTLSQYFCSTLLYKKSFAQTASWNHQRRHHKTTPQQQKHGNPAWQHDTQAPTTGLQTKPYLRMKLLTAVIPAKSAKWVAQKARNLL